MKVYLSSKRATEPSEIIKEMRKDNAQPWGDGDRADVLMGDGRIFIYPPSYKIIGYDLSLEDLEELVYKLKHANEVRRCNKILEEASNNDEPSTRFCDLTGPTF